MLRFTPRETKAITRTEVLERNFMFVLFCFFDRKLGEWCQSLDEEVEEDLDWGS